LQADAAAQDVGEHHPVAGERIERVAERRGPVLLEEEMPDPGETVAAEQRRQQPPGIAAGDRGGHQRQHAPAADEMQPPRNAVRMLGQVERIELAETGELLHVPPFQPWCSAALAFAQYPSWASRGKSPSRRPSASAIASIARKRRSNLALARRSAVPGSTFACLARLAQTKSRSPISSSSLSRAAASPGSAATASNSTLTSSISSCSLAITGPGPGQSKPTVAARFCSLVARCHSGMPRAMPASSEVSSLPASARSRRLCSSHSPVCASTFSTLD